MNDTQDDIKDETHDECQDETLYDASFQILVLVKRNDFRSLLLENMNEVKQWQWMKQNIRFIFKVKTFSSFSSHS